MTRGSAKFNAKTTSSVTAYRPERVLPALIAAPRGMG